MKLKICTQSRIIFDGLVNKISLPTKGGLITILDNHNNLLSILEIGEIELTADNDTKTTLIINGGLIHVENNDALILSDDAVMPHEIIEHEIERAVENAFKKISQKLPQTELIELEKELKYAVFKKNWLKSKKGI